MGHGAIGAVVNGDVLAITHLDEDSEGVRPRCRRSRSGGTGRVGRRSGGGVGARVHPPPAPVPAPQQRRGGRCHKGPQQRVQRWARHRPRLRSARRREQEEGAAGERRHRQSCVLLRWPDLSPVPPTQVFVNPKYADTAKTRFKKPARLECMMQEQPQSAAAFRARGLRAAPRLDVQPREEQQRGRGACQAGAGRARALRHGGRARVLRRGLQGAGGRGRGAAAVRRLLRVWLCAQAAAARRVPPQLCRVLRRDRSRPSSPRPPPSPSRRAPRWWWRARASCSSRCTWTAR